VAVYVSSLDAPFVNSLEMFMTRTVSSSSIIIFPDAKEGVIEI